MGGPKKIRLDILLVGRGLAGTRSLAQRLILAGRVRVDGQTSAQPGKLLPPDADVELEAAPPFVSRGGEKLAAALDAFGIKPPGRVCADAGASTGGFTDCLLQRGAAKVFAIDVGKGILDWKLRNDPRVVVMEDRNARFVACLPEPIDLLTADVSFISLRLLFPVFRGWMKDVSEAVVLIKPQFEAGRGKVGKGGVVKDPAVHRAVLLGVLRAAEDTGFSVSGVIRSPLKGPAGNIEFLAHAKRGVMPAGEDALRSMIDAVTG
ncbi:MAG: TlyA family RNA methyltransferase [Anaerolineales bacterium]|nr:TlyA family RNA methyltransferase [Anaerolineales bacterium]